MADTPDTREGQNAPGQEVSGDDASMRTATAAGTTAFKGNDGREAPEAEGATAQPSGGGASSG